MTDTPLYNPQEGIRGKREGGPFLDEIEREREAVRYNRPLNQTIGLVPADQLVDNVYSNPDHQDNPAKPGPGHAVALGIAAASDDPDTLANAVEDVVPYEGSYNDQAEKDAADAAAAADENATVEATHPVAGDSNADDVVDEALSGEGVGSDEATPVAETTEDESTDNANPAE